MKIFNNKDTKATPMKPLGCLYCLLFLQKDFRCLTWFWVTFCIQLIFPSKTPNSSLWKFLHLDFGPKNVPFEKQYHFWTIILCSFFFQILFLNCSTTPVSFFLLSYIQFLWDLADSSSTLLPHIQHLTLHSLKKSWACQRVYRQI